MIELKSVSEKIKKYQGKKEHLKKESDRRLIEKNRLETRAIAIETAQAFIQQVAKETQDKIRCHLEDIVQLAIDTCFPNEYEFFIRFEIKRGRTEAALVFEQNGIEVDPMESSGGGVVDVSSFALRIATWSLSKTDNVIVLDEPFKHLSTNLQGRAGEILKRLSDKLKLQILMSTHIENIVDVSDRIFEVRRVKEGRFKVSKVELKR
jgi:DNA repair exonuclease SbcCD ATPase subunit